MTALAACDRDPVAPGAPVPTSVSVSPAQLAFESLGDTARLSAEVRDEDGGVIADATVTWSSSDPGVAAVDSAGLVASVGNGAATITAAAGSASGAAAAQVEQVAVRIAFQSSPDSLVVGDSAHLAPEALDALGSPVPGSAFAWESSDPVVLRVSDDGWIRPRVPGAATVTASTASLEASLAVAALPMPGRDVLLRLAAATGGALWKNATNWHTDAPLEAWHGVFVDDDGEIVHIVLPENGLIGHIPVELVSLTRLESLHLGGNLLSGPLPPEIGRMESLRSLDLAYNGISGALPPEIGDLAALEWLGLFDNRLTGEIPPEIGRLSQLAILDLCYNQLSGPLPPEIGRLTRLQRLSLCGRDANPELGNQLVGPLPPEIGNLRDLRHLSLGANQLSGPIPPEIGHLALLDTLLLYSNQLTAIPPEIGNLTRLQTLVIYGNRLAGSIPSEVGRLVNLRNLNLGWGWRSGRNELTGPIPPEIVNLAGLVRLDLGGNQLTGPIPPEIGGLRDLVYLELGSNQLTGSIPAEVGGMTELQSFAVCKNHLNGSIPAENGPHDRPARALPLHQRAVGSGSRVAGPPDAAPQAQPGPATRSPWRCPNRCSRCGSCVSSSG